MSYLNFHHHRHPDRATLRHRLHQNLVVGRLPSFSGTSFDLGPIVETWDMEAPSGGPEPDGGVPSVIISPAKFIIRFAPNAPGNAAPLTAAGRSPWRPLAAVAAGVTCGCAIGNATG